MRLRLCLPAFAFAFGAAFAGTAFEFASAWALRLEGRLEHFAALGFALAACVCVRVCVLRLRAAKVQTLQTATRFLNRAR